MDFWTFCDQHVFIAWCMSWLVWGVIWLAAVAIEVAMKIVSRTFRAANILLRGWPPAHLDADGDWKPEVKSASE